MANTKISALPPAATITGTEMVPVVQAGATKAATVQQLLALVVASAPGNLDTFFEVATQIGLDETTVTTLQTLVASKADKSAVVTLTQAAKTPDLLITGTITRNTAGQVTTAAVLWPDGSPGTYTALAFDPSGATNSYTITYGAPVTKTFTQPTITRDSSAAATVVPQIVVT